MKSYIIFLGILFLNITECQIGPNILPGRATFAYILRQINNMPIIQTLFNNTAQIPDEIEVSRNPFLLGLPIPNLGFNQLETTIEKTGDATYKALQAIEDEFFKLIEPVEDTRTAALTARDTMLRERLAIRNQIMEPLRQSAKQVSSSIVEFKQEADEFLNDTILLPVNRLSGGINRVQSEFIDNIGHQSVTMLCLMRPECCADPAACI